MWDFERFVNSPALIDEYGNIVTYSDLCQIVKSYGAYISKRSLVFILCKNVIGSVIGYIANISIGSVPLLINADTDADIINDLIRVYKPSYIWIPDEKAYIFEQLEKIYSLYGYSLLETKQEKDYDINPKLCLLLSTSGSTGSPKYVRQSYDNVKSNAESIAKYLNLDNSERPITTLPMNYTYGLSIINSHLMVGATILITDKGLMQKEFWEFFMLQGAKSFGGIHYTYEMLDRLRFYLMELPSLRYMTQAGGKLTLELHEKFAQYAQENNKGFIVMYGQCEATARMGYLPKEKAIEKCGSMGIAIPGGRFHLIDDEANRINEVFTVGELVYEGPNVTMGYAESCDDLYKDDERNGILFTGDMAQFDQDGYYYIVGRKKRFLKIYGNRVNLDEIDRLIKGEYKGIDVACAGIDDNLKIYITDGLLADSVRQFIAGKTRLNPKAIEIVIIDEIPRNDSGKVLYNQL